MRCPSWGNETRGDDRFCDNCGVASAARCTACGTVNRPSAQFCDGCGAPLNASRAAYGPGEAPRQRPAPPPSSFAIGIETESANTRNIRARERKTFTALFADIKLTTD